MHTFISSINYKALLLLINSMELEKLDGPAVCAVGVRSQNLSRKASHQMDDQNLLSGATPCFGRHVKPLVPAAFAVVKPSSFKEG
jgi:hypothetical protein